MEYNIANKKNAIVGFVSIIGLCCTFFSAPGWGSGPTGSTSLVASLFKGLAILFPIILLLFVKVFFKFKFDNRNALLSAWVIFPLVILNFYGFIASPWSPFPTISLMRALSFIIVMASCSLISAVFLKMPQHYALFMTRDAVCLSAVVGVLFVLSGGLAGIDAFWRYDGRLGGQIIPTNTLGAFSAILVGISFIRIANKERVLLSIISIMPGILGLYYTFSRSALISLAIGLLFFCLLELLWYPKDQHQSYRNVFIVIMTLCFLLLCGILFFDNILELLTRGEGDIETIRTASSRSILWAKMLNNPGWVVLVGHGFCAISETGFINYGYFITNHAHNGYLQIFLGAGVVGIFLFVWFLYRVFGIIRYSKGIPREHWRIMVFMVTFFMINNLAESSIGYQIYPQFICLLILLGPVSAIKFLNHENKLPPEADELEAG